MPEVIISVAGQPYSGKSNLTKNLEQHRGIAVVRPSEIIREAAAKKGINLTGADRSLWAEARRQLNTERGDDWIAQHVLNIPDKIVALDGLRVAIDYKTLKSADIAGDARVAFMGLFCPIADRFRHVDQGDTNKSRPQSVDELFAQESPEYYSTEGDAGIATQTVLDLTPPELRIEYRRESAEQVYQMAVDRLILFGFIE